MKKFYTLCLSMLMGCMVASAQDVASVDDVYQFTDPEGNVYPDGSYLVFNEPEYDPFGGAIIYSHLHLANVSEATNGSATIVCTINSISNGTFQMCWPNNCISFTAPTTHTFGPTGAIIGYDADLQTEFIPDSDEASCEVVYQVIRGTNTGESYPGSTITVLYTTDPNAGISGVTVEGSNEIVARYSLDGRRLTVPQKGLNIVKYADGRTVKVLVK